MRPYQRADREHIRRICYKTADAGASAASFFADQEVFNDAVTAYYTDYQPDALWVAESAGSVVGYLCGCFDAARYTHVMSFFIIPKVLLKACARGLFVRRYFWRLIRGMLATWARGGYKRPSFSRDYPAHAHIDIDKDFRGCGVGRLLMEQFLRQARAGNVRGVHLSTRLDNTQACAFFEALGFRLLGRYPVLLPQTKGYKESEIGIFGIGLLP